MLALAVIGSLHPAIRNAPRLSDLDEPSQAPAVSG
jgi:hypothetical protein